MQTLRGVYRLLGAALQVLHGMLVMTQFGGMTPVQRQARIRWWSAGMLRRMGIAVHISGTPHTGASLLVSNHVSWLDIVAIHSAVPQARFVSKADVLAWPLLGWLIKGAGTLFIERERKRDAVRVVHAMAQALQDGQTVAVFPEGTTGWGPELLPFHANLLQAAIATGVPVQPLVLHFSDAAQPFSSAAAFVGDTTLLQSVWRVACARDLKVQVALLPPAPTVGAERRQLAEQLRQNMAQHLVLRKRACGAESTS